MEATGQSPPQEPTDTHMSELEWITLREELKAEHGMKRGHGDSKFGNLRSVILPLALTGAAVTTAVLGGGLYTMMRRPEKQGQMMKARVASQFITLSILVIGAGIARYF